MVGVRRGLAAAWARLIEQGMQDLHRHGISTGGGARGAHPARVREQADQRQEGVIWYRTRCQT
jgi:hypothetical protein